MRGLQLMSFFIFIALVYRDFSLIFRLTTTTNGVAVEDAPLKVTQYQRDKFFIQNYSYQGGMNLNPIKCSKPTTPSRVIIHQRWESLAGGAEALLQLALAFHSWMPNGTYVQGLTVSTETADQWFDWYPEIRALKAVDPNKALMADVSAMLNGDIYIIPEVYPCPTDLVKMGVNVFIWKLGSVHNRGHDTLAGQRRYIQDGCKYLSHDHFLTSVEELKISEDKILLPYMSPPKSHSKIVVSNVNRKRLIIVNGHDPSSQNGDQVKRYCSTGAHKCKVIVLEGFNTTELLDLYQTAMIVVGFCMRGSERSPIEAALAGAVLVSNECLAGQDEYDFPIPRENIVNETNPVEKVMERIMNNFDEEQDKMRDMRALYHHIGPATLATQTQNFMCKNQGIQIHLG